MIRIRVYKSILGKCIWQAIIANANNKNNSIQYYISENAYRNNSLNNVVIQSITKVNKHIDSMLIKNCIKIKSQKRNLASDVCNRIDPIEK